MARKHQRRIRELSETPRTDSGPRYIAGEDEVGPILSSWAFALMSFLAFLAVVAGAVVFGTENIEASLQTGTLRYLQSTGFDQVDVSVNGRNVTLSGLVPDDTAIEGLPAAVSELNGVRAVDSELDITTPEVVAGPVAADPLVITWVGDDVTVSGTVSTDDIRTFIVDELDNRFATVTADELVVRDGVGDETEWIGDVVVAAERTAAETSEGQVVVNPDESLVTVAAELPDRQQRADLRTETEDLLAGGGLRFISGLTFEDAPPPPPPEVVEEVQGRLDDLIEGKVVEFELNSAELTPVGEELLDEIVDALAQFPEVGVEIGGHADSQGDDADNLALSERRARSVKVYLVDRGIDGDRLAVVGYGETRPIADNSTAEGRARNRRIEFTALED